MFAIGDVVSIYAPQAGHKKYHICVYVGNTDSAYRFLYLNSDPTFADTYCVECNRVPRLPPSDTVKTVFTFAIVPRYTEKQLAIFRAEKLGELDSRLAAQVHDFASKVRTMAPKEREFVLAALAAIRDPERRCQYPS